MSSSASGSGSCSGSGSGSGRADQLAAVSSSRAISSACGSDTGGAPGTAKRARAAIHSEMPTIAHAATISTTISHGRKCATPEMTATVTISAASNASRGTAEGISKRRPGGA